MLDLKHKKTGILRFGASIHSRRAGARFMCRSTRTKLKPGDAVPISIPGTPYRSDPPLAFSLAGCGKHEHVPLPLFTIAIAFQKISLQS